MYLYSQIIKTYVVFTTVNCRTHFSPSFGMFIKIAASTLWMLKVTMPSTMYQSWLFLLAVILLMYLFANALTSSHGTKIYKQLSKVTIDFMASCTSHRLLVTPTTRHQSRLSHFATSEAYCYWWTERPMASSVIRVATEDLDTTAAKHEHTAIQIKPHFVHLTFYV